VAWITERKNLLSTSFYLAAMLAYLRFAGLGTERRGVGSGRVYALSLVAFVAAVLSKTVACSLPVVLLLLLWWKRGRVDSRSALPLMPMFAFGLALGLLTVWLERNQIMAEGSEWDLSPVERALIAGRALWFYLGKLVWPLNLSFVYPRWEIDPRQWWQYLYPLSFAGLVIGLWVGRRRIDRGLLITPLVFGVVLFPALGFFDVYPMRFSFVADHFQYVACVAPMALFSAGLALAIARWSARPVVGRLAWAGVGGVLVLLAATTHARAGIYRSNETLWRDTLERNPSAWLAHLNLGGELERRGAYSEAERHWREVVRLGPDAHIALTNLGTMYERRLRQTEQAERWYRAAIELQPEAPTAYNNLAWLLATHPSAAVRNGREAVRLAEQAARLTGFGSPAILDTLAAAYAETNRFADAIQTLETALRLAAAASEGELRDQLLRARDLYRAGQPLRVPL
jgi:tetratricopeptide (TPR) repeat protein